MDEGIAGKVRPAAQARDDGAGSGGTERAGVALGAAPEREAVAKRTTLDAALPFVDELRRARGFGERVIVALAGPPASGKSTLADGLAARLGQTAIVLPMDGFHLDNAVLDARGLRARKGAPATFDVAGFASALSRVRSDKGAVVVPTFDRKLDLARAGAREIASTHRVVIVEGNYLLLDEAPWSAIARLYDGTIMLRVPEPVIEARILARWRRYGLDERAARTRALENDVPNASHVMRTSRAPDLAIDERGARMEPGGDAASRPTAHGPAAPASPAG